jgi:hypothetical protein
MAKLSTVSRVMICAVRHQTRVTSHPVRNGGRSKLWTPVWSNNAAAALGPAVEPVQWGRFESLAQVEGVQGPDLAPNLSNSQVPTVYLGRVARGETQSAS